MADNVNLKDASSTTFQAAADELSDSSFAPKVAIVTGGSPTVISPATEGTLGDIKTAVEVIDNIVSGSEAQVDVVAALPAGTNNIGKVSPVAAMVEDGITEIIDADDAEVDQNEYSATADLALGGSYSGTIRGVELVLTPGSGAVQAGDGVLFFFDADPNTSSGDTSISVAERKTIIGQVDVAAADWDTDAAGGSVHKQVQIPFHAVSTIYAVFRNTDATAVFNSDAGDDEELHMNMWYDRHS